MTILLWILQILLALHTLIGAFWKFSNPAQQVASLSAISPAVWLALSGLELVCAIGLLLPAISRRYAALASLAAILIAAEMLAFCAVQMASGVHDPGSLVYWLIVAAIAAFIAWGRRTSTAPAR